MRALCPQLLSAVLSKLLPAYSSGGGSGSGSGGYGNTSTSSSISSGAVAVVSVVPQGKWTIAIAAAVNYPLRWWKSMYICTNSMCYLLRHRVQHGRGDGGRIR